MRRLLLLAVLPLAACSGDIDLTNASIAEVASATASIEKPVAGQWRTDTRLVSFDAGADKTPTAAAIREQVGDTSTTEACLTDEEAAKPLFGDLSTAAGANCRFRRFTLKGEQLDAEMACRNAGGETLTVSQKGRYSPSAVDLTATVRRGGVAAQAGGMVTRIVAKRTGDCAEE
ncbi:DUF3617 domain-containing protein [Sphingomonas sp.]|uniref:DUF3617 domain-containing protein n=1 Tax=Sphingomonas sp. TaxID=28214 RepID=UPI0035C7C068